MKQKSSNKVSTLQLPSYKKPPVNEVICGMRYQTPTNIWIPHIGILWSKFRQEYPNIQHANPIFSSPLEDLATGLPLPRIWFINEQDDQLIQFQFDRFYYNWRRRNDNYPRYPHVITKFKQTLDLINAFFDENGFGQVLPLEMELSYINHIPQGEGWEKFEDIQNLFTDFKWESRTGRFLPNPIKIKWTAIFQFPDEKGLLTVNIKEAKRMSDKVPLIVFELIAKKTCETTIKQDEIYSWYDLAHEWIVRGFTDLTSPKVQKDVWEIENA